MFKRRDASDGHADVRKRAGALYEMHAPRLLAICLRYCGNIEDAEDVLHEGFIKIFTHLGRFRDNHPGSTGSWMKRIMINTALNYLRDHSKERRIISLDQIHEVAPQEEREHASEEMPGTSHFSNEMLMELLCRLPQGYRTVFNLYVLESWSHREIARELGISEGTSKSQLSKARSMLRSLLNEKNKAYQYADAREFHR